MLKSFRLNAGTGMALGAIIAVLVALLINWLTGNGDIWAWAIPIGVAIGLAVGNGAANQRKMQSKL